MGICVELCERYPFVLEQTETVVSFVLTPRPATYEAIVGMISLLSI